MKHVPSAQGRSRGGALQRVGPCVAAVVVMLGCSTTARLDWRFVLDDGVAASDVVFVEARVLRACGGSDALWRGAADADGLVTGGTPPRLAAGSYGLAGRAFDARCAVVAEGCVTVSTPTSGVMDVVLTSASNPEVACPAEFRSRMDAGAADGGALDVDGGALDVDGGALDAGRTDASASDAGALDLRVIRAITAGNSHTCALMNTGDVQCFGVASALGRAYGACESSYLVNPTPAIIPVPSLPPAVAIAAGDFHTCAATVAGEVWCWGGDGAAGELGAASGCVITECTECVDGARRIDLGAGAGRVVGVAAGGNHSCALTERGEVWCWGSTWSGSEAPPARVLGVADIVQIAAGGAVTCARDRGGAVHCWGANSFGQLGTGVAGPPTATPTRLYLMGMTATHVDVSATHGCATTDTGETLCWGEDADGQTGSGMASTSLVACPAVVRGVIRTRAAAGSESAVLVSTGASEGLSPPACDDGVTCILGDGGAVRCWGSNADGRAGSTGSVSAATGVEVALGGVAHALAVGKRHGCAVVGTNWDRLMCWGQSAAFGLFVSPPGRFMTGEAVPIALPGSSP